MLSPAESDPIYDLSRLVRLYIYITSSFRLLIERAFGSSEAQIETVTMFDLQTRAASIVNCTEPRPSKRTMQN